MYELSTLTGTQNLLLAVSESGLVYSFTTSKLRPIVTQSEGKNLIQSLLAAPANPTLVDAPTSDGLPAKFPTEPSDGPSEPALPHPTTLPSPPARNASPPAPLDSPPSSSTNPDAPNAPSLRNESDERGDERTGMPGLRFIEDYHLRAITFSARKAKMMKAVRLIRFAYVPRRLLTVSRHMTSPWSLGLRSLRCSCPRLG